MQTASLQQAVDRIRDALACYADSVRGMQETLQRQQQALARMGRASDAVQAVRPIAVRLARSGGRTSRH